ncbi:MAG: DUF1134 domain-containing protein [Sphingomonadales bacterium]
MLRHFNWIVPLFLAGILLSPPVAAQDADDTFDQDTIFNEADEFFGGASEGLAKVVEKVFSEQGRPNAYITGQVIGGALIVGVRYGDGRLTHKIFGEQRVYWRGPSIGVDAGAEGSKVFMLVYHLPDIEQIFQTFAALEGSAYFIGGIGVNYQQRDDIILAPIRTGVGLRFGANLGYVKFTRKRSYLPF